jgi:hypothetical protein
MVGDKPQFNKTFIRVMASIALVFLLFETSYRVARSQDSNSPVFWIAAAVEAFAAYVTYKLRNRSSQVQGLAVVFAYFIAIIFYYFKLLSLESAFNAIFIHAIVSLVFFIYNPPAIKNLAPKRMLLTLQFSSSLHLVLLALGVVGISFLLSKPDFTPVFRIGDPALIIAQFAQALFALVAFVIGFLLPRFFRWHKRRERTFFEVQFVHNLQAALFESIGASVFVLFILGGRIEWLPMLLVSIVSQLTIFPTEKRLVSWLNSVTEESHEPI